MKDKEQLFAAYPDLLGEEADAGLLRLVSHLDASYTAVEPPAHLVLAGAPTVRAQQTAQEKSPITPAQARPLARVLAFRQSRLMPRRLTTVAAALLLALALMAGGVYAAETLLSQVIGYDPGTKQVAVQKLYQDVHQSQKIGGFTVTVEQAYADPNRVIITYTVKKPAGHIYNHASLNTTLTTQDGLVLPLIGGDGYGNRNGDDAYADWFDGAVIPGTPKELHLHLTGSGLGVTQQDGDDSTVQNYTVAGSAVFDFTVAFHPGRIANLHQSVTSGGTTITLERVVVTVSETRVYLRGAGDVVGRLSVDGWDSERDNGGAITVWKPSDGLTAFSYSVSLADTRGEWTLVVSTLSGSSDLSSPSAGGPWAFHFQVP